MVASQTVRPAPFEDLPVVLPSILSSDFSRLAEETQQMENLGVRALHVDVMDGRFVPNITIGPDVVEAVHGSVTIPLDVHLMIEYPEQHLEAFAKAGASVLTVHAEACRHLHRVIQQIKSYGVKAGVSLNPATPLSAVSEVLSDLDLLLIMTVNPGFGGQSFIEQSWDKLRRAAEALKKAAPHAVLQADGGCGPSNAQQVAACGVSWLVAGSAIFKAADRKKAFHDMTEGAKKGLAQWKG